MAATVDEYGRTEAGLIPLLPSGTKSMRLPSGRPQVPMVKLLELVSKDTRMGRRET